MRSPRLKLLAGAATFPSNNEGNVAIIFAIALPIIVGTIGGGIDLARASKMRAALTHAVDSTAARIEETRISCPRDSSSRNTDITNCTTRDGEKLTTFAARHITAEFQGAGFDSKVQIGPTVSLNPTNNRVILTATSSYSCTLVKLLSSSCDINVGSRSNTPAGSENAVAAMSLSAPTQAEIWIDEYGSPALPTRLSAKGGKSPYQFAIGPNLPEGLQLDPVSGSITGKPSAIPCDLDCKPQIRKIAVTAFDASSPNRMAASGVVTYQIIHPLKVEIKQTQQGNVSSLETIRTGGKPPFQYMCMTPLLNTTCDTATGKIVRFGTASGGEITITVTDARGKSATAKANISP